MKKPLFESKVCGRCGGTGTYSFNMMHGSTCYGCGGAGMRLTKRGRAAQVFLDNLRKIPAENFKVGDLFLVDGMFTGGAHFERVTSVVRMNGEEAGYVGHPEYKVVKITTEKGNGVVTFEGVKYRKGFSAEEKAEQIQKALAYQATLNGAGVTSKKLARSAK